jgi:hypothetical protein
MLSRSIIPLVLSLLIMAQDGSKLMVQVHFMINRAHIAAELCENRSRPDLQCNGQCHLKRELNKEKKRERSPSGEVNEKSELVLFPPEAGHQLSKVLMCGLSEFSFYIDPLSNKHVPLPIRPPCFS